MSLTVATEASLASTAPALDTMMRDAGVILCDISLAAFHVFDNEGAKPFPAGKRPVTVGQGCCLFACLAMLIHPRLPIRPRRRVRLGRRTSPFGKSDKTLPRLLIAKIAPKDAFGTRAGVKLRRRTGASRS